MCQLGEMHGYVMDGYITSWSSGLFQLDLHLVGNTQGGLFDRCKYTNMDEVTLI